MICDKCGHINPNINKTCDKCGKKLEPAPRYPQQTNKQTNRTYHDDEGLFDDIKNLSTDKKIIGVCCLLLVFLFAVSSVLPYDNDTDILPADDNNTTYVTDVNNSPEVVETTKINTKINVTAKSPVKSGESTIIKGYLMDESENPLKGYDVTIKIANNEYTVNTRSDGSYTFEYNDTENGSQNVSVEFYETDNYYSSSNDTFFEVINKTDEDENTSTDDDINKSTNISDDEHDNHDTHNSILSWIFNNKNNTNTDNNQTYNNTSFKNNGNNSINTKETNNTTLNNTEDNTKNNTTLNDTKNINTTHSHNDSDDNDSKTENDTKDNNNTTYNKTEENNTTDYNKSVDNQTNNQTDNTNNNTTDDKENSTTKNEDTKSNSHLTLELEDNISINETSTINISLVDENNTPIRNAAIKIIIDNNETIVHTDNNGEYTLEYTQDDDKTRDIEVIFEGDEKYLSTHQSKKIMIK